MFSENRRSIANSQRRRPEDIHQLAVILSLSEIILLPYPMDSIFIRFFLWCRPETISYVPRFFRFLLELLGILTYLIACMVFSISLGTWLALFLILGIPMCILSSLQTIADRLICNDYIRELVHLYDSNYILCLARCFPSRIAEL